MAVLTGFIISLVAGRIVIPFLKKFNLNQTIKEFEPEAHQSKKGTPTMGGIIILVGFFVSSVMWVRLDVGLVWISLLSMFLFASIGFLDDIFKVSKGKGISARLKFSLQVLSAFVVCFLVTVIESHLMECSSCLFIPFTKGVYVDLGIFYLLFGMFVIVGSSNAVNLTDGLDGLATGPAIMSSVPLVIFAYISGNVIFSHYLHIPHIRGAGELSVVGASLIGSLLGFLWYNCYPAEVFMGDSGSLAIGGFLGTVAVMLKEEVVFAIAGGLFVFETFSVILQVLSYKATGRRLFKMAPIHHHFELKDWSESKVIVRFWIISLILSLLALTAIKVR